MLSAGSSSLSAFKIDPHDNWTPWVPHWLLVAHEKYKLSRDWLWGTSSSHRSTPWAKSVSGGGGDRSTAWLTPATTPASSLHGSFLEGRALWISRGQVFKWGQLLALYHKFLGSYISHKDADHTFGKSKQRDPELMFVVCTYLPLGFQSCFFVCLFVFPTLKDSTGEHNSENALTSLAWLKLYEKMQ